MKSTTALVLSALAVVVIVALVSAQPPRPSVDHQTSYGIISSVNEWGALEERTAITAIDPKLKLYRSDQSTMRDAQGLYANETHLQYVHHGYCWTYPYRWIFSVDYFYKTEYLGREQITTRYFFNETCYRFHGAPPDYDYTFDLYSKMDDTDFIVRQVTYSNGSFRGSVVDHSHYSYEFHDANYFRFPCRVKRDVQEPKGPKLTLEEFQALVQP